jgi:uncharacterized membrane protein YgdD (TMEM256/DUF423 family)
MQWTRERTSLFRALCLTAAATVVFGVWIGAGFGGETTVRYVDDLATGAAALVAAAFCARAAIEHADRLRLFWWLLAGACGAWALGEGLWALYDLVGGDVPASSLADVAYLAALPLAAAALLVHPALQGRAIGKTRSLVDGLVIAASLFFVAWTLVLEPLQRTTDVASLDSLVTLAYPLGDVVIISLVVLVMRGTTSRVGLDLWCLLAGLLMITLSDALYTYLTNVQDYSSGNVIDTGWFAGYLAIALGAFCSRSRVTAARPAESPPSLTPAAILVPFLAMLAALSLVAIKLAGGHSLDRVTLTVAFVLVGLVLFRQALLLIDLLAPKRELEGSMADRLVAALGQAATDDRVVPAPPSKVSR